MKFFTKMPKIISAKEAKRIRRESKNHIIAAQEGVAIHMCVAVDGAIVVVDEAPKQSIRETKS